MSALGLVKCIPFKIIFMSAKFLILVWGRRSGLGIEIQIVGRQPIFRIRNAI